MKRFLLITDTPGIKQFVFGTDTLAEVRGASALLDRLNREETERILRESLSLPADSVQVVYANGGTGQLIINQADCAAVEAAVAALARAYREATGDDARIVWGLVPWPENTPFKEASSAAHLQMRTWRETASANRCSPLFPLMLECSSTSHLPSLTHSYYWGNEEPSMLSNAAIRKREESRRQGRRGIWLGWMVHLETGGQWPDENRWPWLRPQSAVEFEKARRGTRQAARRGYVGLVYADGNAMGRLVQETDSPETCQAFSTIVDDSIREACYHALTQVCAPEIAAIREEQSNGPLPADILLLGGDDLLVLLPADLALDFAMLVTEEFESQTRQRIAALPEGSARRFFQERQVERMTISCGVALATASYPFYLLLDLAEELLRNAKKAGSRDPSTGKYYAPATIDFHLVVGPQGADLATVREIDYLVGVRDNWTRTLRPYSVEKLKKLKEGAQRIQSVRTPRSKLHDLWAASLDPRIPRAEARCRELFSRLRERPGRQERQALWQALRELGMGEDFPWCPHGDAKATALADLVEAVDLFPREEEGE
jgi:hypothetical protein